MNEETKEIIIKPDPSLILEKIIKPCMSWHHKAIGWGLVFLGIWWCLRNLEIIPQTIFWPVIIILIGIGAIVEANTLWKK